MGVSFTITLRLKRAPSLYCNPALSLFCNSTQNARNSSGRLPHGYCERTTHKSWKDDSWCTFCVVINLWFWQSKQTNEESKTLKKIPCKSKSHQKTKFKMSSIIFLILIQSKSTLKQKFCTVMTRELWNRKSAFELKLDFK